MYYEKEILMELIWARTIKTQELDLVQVETILVETSRWSLHYRMIFKDVNLGKLFETFYLKGATEMQDESPYDYEPDLIEVYEVFQSEKVVSTYVSSSPKTKGNEEYTVGKVARKMEEEEVDGVHIHILDESVKVVTSLEADEFSILMALLFQDLMKKGANIDES